MPHYQSAWDYTSDFPYRGDVRLIAQAYTGLYTVENAARLQTAYHGSNLARRYINGHSSCEKAPTQARLSWLDRVANGQRSRETATHH
jgi:hypothetical protein